MCSKRGAGVRHSWPPVSCQQSPITFIHLCFAPGPTNWGSPQKFHPPGFRAGADRKSCVGRLPERAQGKACHSQSCQRGKGYNEEATAHGRGRLAPVLGWKAGAGTAASPARWAVRDQRSGCGGGLLGDPSRAPAPHTELGHLWPHPHLSPYVPPLEVVFRVVNNQCGSKHGPGQASASCSSCRRAPAGPEPSPSLRPGGVGAIDASAPADTRGLDRMALSRQITRLAMLKRIEHSLSTSPCSECIK